MVRNLNTFPLRSGAGQGCFFSSLLFNIILEVQVKAIIQLKEIKSILVGKKEIELLLLTNSIIIFLKNLKESQNLS